MQTKGEVIFNSKEIAQHEVRASTSLRNDTHPFNLCTVRVLNSSQTFARELSFMLFAFLPEHEHRHGLVNRERKLAKVITISIRTL